MNHPRIAPQASQAGCSRGLPVILEPISIRNLNDSVQITMSEYIGVDGRGGFFEEVGAIRDVVQNHLLEVLAILMIEAPIGSSARAFHDEKSRILRACAPIAPDQTVRGQFDAYRETVEAAWAIIEPIVIDPRPLESYAPGTRRPTSTDQLVNGHSQWYAPVEENSCR